MTIRSMLRFLFVLAMLLCVAPQAMGQATPKPSDPLRVTAKSLTPPAGGEIKPPRSTLIRGHAFLTNDGGLISREVTYVFGAYDTTGEVSEFQIIPFPVPTEAENPPPQRHYSRPVLYRGFVYARAHMSEKLVLMQRDLEERGAEINRTLATLQIDINTLADREDQSEESASKRLLNTHQIASILHEELGVIREQQNELDQAGDRNRRLIQSQKTTGLGMFRLIMGIIIDGTVDGTDIVAYAEKGMYDFDGDDTDEPATFVHMVLTHGDSARTYDQTRRGSSVKDLSATNNYIKYAIPDTIDDTHKTTVAIEPTPFCEYVHDEDNRAQYLCKIVMLACEVYDESADDYVAAHRPCDDCEYDEE